MSNRRKIIAIVTCCLLTVLLAAAGYAGMRAGSVSAADIPESGIPLADPSLSDRYLANEKSLASSLTAMQSDTYMFDAMLSVEDARLFKYEFYALHPEVTLHYSPRFASVGYEKDTDMCAGYKVEYLSDSGGEMRYAELQSETEGLIRSLRGKTDKEKIRRVREWISDRCSYTKSPRNMWDESLYGCLVKGSATCLGYSQGFLYMMDRLGVPCRIECSKHHAWNIAYDGEKWVKIDLTKE